MKTQEMIEVLFPDTSVESISEIVGIFNLYGSKYGLNKSIRVAHFLAQVREEVGSEFKPIRENLNYKPSSLLATYSAFSDSLANKYGRTDKQKANQEAIANIAYANKLGNGNADSDNDGDMDKDDDGYKYRGAGCLQVTGKYNFQEVQARINKYSPEANVDILNRNDANTLLGSILMGMAFWVWKDLYAIADKGTTNEVVDKITSKVNRDTHSYRDRQSHFNIIKHLIKE